MPGRIALALGSGGARGYAHIGVIEALTERGYQIVAVAGSSMGAVVGGALAAGELPAFTSWARSLSQRDVLRHLDPSRSSSGVIRAERIITRLGELVGERMIEDLPMRFTAVAVDLLAGREVWLDRGPLDRAVRASIGIPGLITPLAVNGRLLVDGGVLSPVPVAATATAQADLVVAVSLQGPRTHPAGASLVHDTAEKRPTPEWWERFRTNTSDLLNVETLPAITQRLITRREAADREEPDEVAAQILPSISLIQALTLTLDISQSALANYCLAAHVPDILITVPKDACRTLDFHKADELIELGRRLADETLAPTGPGPR